MNFEYYRTSPLIQNCFKSIIWKNSTENPLLTFDDGPDDKWTFKFAELLHQESIRAIFFFVGDKLKNKSLIKDITALRHELAWHSQTHRSFYKLSKKEIENELAGYKSLEDISSSKVRFFRFPFGEFFPWQIKHVLNQNLTPMMWTLMLHDYKMKNNSELIKTFGKAKPSDIILLHDSNKNAENVYNSLKQIIQNKSLTFTNEAFHF